MQNVIFRDDLWLRFKLDDVIVLSLKCFVAIRLSGSIMALSCLFGLLISLLANR